MVFVPVILLEPKGTILQDVEARDRQVFHPHEGPTYYTIQLSHFLYTVISRIYQIISCRQKTRLNFCMETHSLSTSNGGT